MLDAYGQKLRSAVTAASQNVTADTSAKDLLTGNRLNYMRSNEPRDQEKKQKKEVTNRALQGVNTALVEHLKQSTMPEIFQGDIMSPGELSTKIKEDPTNERYLEMQRKSDEISAAEIEHWLDLMQQDPKAMEHFRNHVERVYRPMGAFDPENNKGGIVGGEKNSGVYALNDLFLRSSAPNATPVTGSGSGGTVRAQMGMRFMNRVFNKTGDVDSMDPNERKVYGRMLDFGTQAPAVQPAAQESDPESDPEAD